MSVKVTNRNPSQELAACSRAVLAADQAYLREALESVGWERRGWLGRLVRTERPAAKAEFTKRQEDRRVAA